jgi:curli biogenesis system outer membrane secretion channel CsgG
MNRRQLRAGCVGLALWSSSALPAWAGQEAPAAGGDRPTLAIVDFETRPAGSILPPPGLGSALAELMLSRLVESGKYRVLDGRWVEQTRENLTPISQLELMRQHLSDAGVDYVLLGSMQRFSMEDRRRTYGAGVVVPLITGVRRNKTELAVAITVRVVDVRSGEIAITAASQATANRSNLSLGALGLFRHGGGGGFSKSSSGSREAMLDEAIRRAVAAAAEGVINASTRLQR